MGSGLSTIGQDPIPAAGDAVFVHTDVAQYANAIDHKIIQWAADVAERDVLYAAAAAPLFVMSPTALWCKVSGSGGSSVWVTLWGDSGEVSSGIVAATNFDFDTGFIRRLNEKLVVVHVTMIRRNSALAANAYNHASAPGNITDTVAFTVPAGYRPLNPALAIGTWWSGTTNGFCRVESTGECFVMTGLPSTSIAQDADVTFNLVYTI